jgi:hypothetical protein
MRFNVRFIVLVLFSNKDIFHIRKPYNVHKPIETV